MDYCRTMTRIATTCRNLTALAALLAVTCCTPVSPEPAGRSLNIPARRSPWKTPRGTGEVARTKHYRIFTNLPDGPLASSLPGVMEAAHQLYMDLTSLTSPAVDEPFDMYMVATRHDWESLTRLRMGHQAGAALKLEAGGYTVNGVTVCWNIGGIATTSVAAHEGMHQFLYHRLKNRLPLWAEEGLATTCEGINIHRDRVTFTPETNTLRQGNLRDTLLRKQWVPLGMLLQSDPKELVATGRGSVLGYYAQVWALMHWLRNTPEFSGGLRRMLEDAAAGRFKDAVPPRHLQLPQAHYNRAVALPLFRYYIAEDIESLNDRFRRYAEKLAGL
jgi:hypothetical protein